MLHFAIVLVELDLRKEKEHFILYERSEHFASASIGYEQHPAFCPYCENLGHFTSDCSRGHPKQVNMKTNDRTPNAGTSGPNKPSSNSGPSTTSSGPNNGKPISGPISSKSGTNRGKTHIGWMQKGGSTPTASQSNHIPVATNALIIYSAPDIPTGNSFSMLNGDLPDGLDNDDVQEYLLARVTMMRHAPMPLTQVPASSIMQELYSEPDVDGATASESEDELVEKYTNDPIPPDSASTKIAKKRGRPRKEDAAKKPPTLTK